MSSKIVGDALLQSVPLTVVREVRSFISDYADTNEIFEGEQNSDHKIARYVKRAIDTFNGTPPVFRQGIEPLALSIPNAAPVRELIIKKASALILRAAMHRFAMNDVPYTAGNVTLQRNSIWRNLQPLVQELDQEFANGTQALKTSANISGAWGGQGGNAGITAQLGLPSGKAWRDILTEHFSGSFPEVVDINDANY